MKKRMSRILSILLVSALVVSTGSVVQAEDVEEPAEVQLADETEEPVAEEPTAAGPEVVAEPEVEIDALSAEGAEILDSVDISSLSKDLSAQAQVVKNIPVKMAPTGSETLTENELGGVVYNSYDDVKSDRRFGYSQSFTVPSNGVLDFAVGIVDIEGTNTVYFGVYKDANLTQEVEEDFVTGKGSTKERYIAIPSAGTYYLGVKSVGTSVLTC